MAVPPFPLQKFLRSCHRFHYALDAYFLRRLHISALHSFPRSDNPIFTYILRSTLWAC